MVLIAVAITTTAALRPRLAATPAAAAALPTAAVPGEHAGPTAAAQDAALAAAIRDHAGSSSELASLSDAARQAITCRQRAQGPRPSSVLPEGVDEGADRAADLARRLAERDQRAQCRRSPVLSDAQIDALLQADAAHGDARARRTLLARQVDAVFARAGTTTGEDPRPPLSAADEHEIEAVVTQLEDMALRGDRDAIAPLAQLLQSPLVGVADPAYAAAWQLAARQAADRPFPATEQAIGTEEVLDGLSETQRQQALALAPDLFAQCCARR